MGGYELTHAETWCLALLLDLPIQPASSLAAWLALDPSQGALLDCEHELARLKEKGYYSEDNSTPIDESLIASLIVLAVNPAVLTVLLRSYGQVALSRFAQRGKALVQFGTTQTHFWFDDVWEINKAVEILLPAFFVPRFYEAYSGVFSLEQFLLFKQACNLEDWAWARSGFATKGFPSGELLDIFRRTSVWLDVFEVLELDRVRASAQIPLPETLRALVERGDLVEREQGVLEVGDKVRPLAAALTSDDTCTLTCSLLLDETEEEKALAFLYGAERLFLLEFSQVEFQIQQLANRSSALAQLNHLLSFGGT